MTRIPDFLRQTKILQQQQQKKKKKKKKSGLLIRNTLRPDNLIPKLQVPFPRQFTCLNQMVISDNEERLNGSLVTRGNARNNGVSMEEAAGEYPHYGGARRRLLNRRVQAFPSLLLRSAHYRVLEQGSVSVMLGRVRASQYQCEFGSPYPYAPNLAASSPVTDSRARVALSMPPRAP